MLSLGGFLVLFQKRVSYVLYVCLYRGFNQEEKWLSHSHTLMHALNFVHFEESPYGDWGCCFSVAGCHLKHCLFAGWSTDGLQPVIWGGFSMHVCLCACTCTLPMWQPSCWHGRECSLSDFSEKEILNWKKKKPWQNWKKKGGANKQIKPRNGQREREKRIFNW